VPEKKYKTGKNGKIGKLGKNGKNDKKFSMHEKAGFCINQNPVITLKNFL